MRYGLWLTLMTLLSSSACANNAGDLTVWHGAQSQAKTAGTEVVKDQAAWTQLWQRLNQPAPLAALADDKIAVAVTIGQKRTGGYGVEILGAQEDAANLVVTYRVQKPAIDAMVTQVLTAPYAVALVNKTAKPVVFTKID